MLLHRECGVAQIAANLGHTEHRIRDDSISWLIWHCSGNHVTPQVSCGQSTRRWGSGFYLSVSTLRLSNVSDGLPKARPLFRS